MDRPNDRALDERVLVLAPTAGDAALSRTLLAEAGLACHVCSDVCGLEREFEQGAGALLLTEEVLADSDSHCLVDALRQQPQWSDVPILLLTGGSADSPVAVWAMEMLGNVTLLERPVRVTILVSALRTALRARRRQYELRNQVEALRQSERQFRTLAESIPQLAWMANPDGHVFWYNRRWYDYTGTTFEQMEGWGWQGVHDPDELPRVLSKFRAHVTSGEPWEDTFPLRRHDGAMRWHLSRAMPLKDEQGRVLRWFGTNTDITEQRELERALSEADHRKDEFLATLAHELRNPLAPIRNGLQVLRLAGDDRQAIEKARTIIDRQLPHLMRLVDDLMDVGRIRQGKLELRRGPVDLAAVLNGAVETSRTLIERMGHELTVTLPRQPIVLDGDLTRLAQVFSNLLNNAAKYTERDGRIWLTAERQGGDVVVDVRDNGIGIPADMLPRIFEMFTQVDRSLERSQGGLGIGLTLVKQLVEMHGGRVEAKSEGPGKGSEFVVRLPVVVEASKPQASRSDEEPAAVKSSLRILIVDDNRDSAASLGMLLSLMGNEIRTAHDGLEGVEAAAVFRPHLILLDIGLPKLNGYEACRRIREQPWGKGVVIIACTGWGQEEDIRRSNEAGFDQHMVKPVDPAALEKLLAEIVVTREGVSGGR